LLWKSIAVCSRFRDISESEQSEHRSAK